MRTLLEGLYKYHEAITGVGYVTGLVLLFVVWMISASPVVAIVWFLSIILLPVILMGIEGLVIYSYEKWFEEEA